jgi:hypothetical protein
VGIAIKPKASEVLDRNLSSTPPVRSVVPFEHRLNCLLSSSMAPPGVLKTASGAGSSQGGRKDGQTSARPVPQGTLSAVPIPQERAPTRPMRLLMAPPVGGGD